MPVTYQIDKIKGAIYTKCAGNVTLPEVVDHFKELVRDPDCPARLDVLLDLSETTSIPEALQLRAVSDQIGIIRERVAFGDCAIVTRSEVLYGMLRIFEIFAGKWFRGIRVCRAREDAQTWLDSRSPIARESSNGAAAH